MRATEPVIEREPESSVFTQGKVREDDGKEKIAIIGAASISSRRTVSLVHIVQIQMRSSAQDSLENPEFADSRAKWTLEVCQLAGLTV